ncbi:MAG: SIS domain-containing protein [Kiritimatiellae bacterium]|nr:SIS domain-containing protein [Kiritimatiellia bacterium]MDW8458097.1 SIS domain-containing protein [Verrucomicrobiota bacterium]
MNWDAVAADHLAVLDEVINRLRPDVERTAELLAGRLKVGGKVLICGNGGSAADAQHIAGELVNRFLRERAPYAAVALTTDTSILTAIGNDYSFELIFEKQVRALGRAGDVLLAISTSGRAANVIRAARAAREIGLTVVTMTGGTGGDLITLADIPLNISCTKSTPRIQEGHLLLYHALCERLEELMEAGP